MEHHIVIGANYGDEGKGLMTDYLVRKHKIKQVVRFNGGAQAGHTVKTADKRVVFSSFGAGTLAGATTRLTPDCVLNPWAAFAEATQEHSCADPIEVEIKRSNHSPITTPLEIRLNQIAEELRGAARHGSCGMGINETVTRHLEMAKNNINTNIINDESWDWVCKVYLPQRMQALNFTEDYTAQLISELPAIREMTLDVFDTAMGIAFHERRFSLDNEPLVYEGAQGLALHETRGVFPHVTRSDTGIKNAIVDIVRTAQMHAHYLGLRTKIKVNLYYMTRAYVTRHGAGPLYCEMPPEQLSRGIEFGTGKFVDETNHPNPWQGSLRFAPLDIDAIEERIRADLTGVISLTTLSNIELNPSVVITCADQFSDALLVSEKRNTKMRCNMLDLPKLFSLRGLKVSHMSFGPTAADVKEM